MIIIAEMFYEKSLNYDVLNILYSEFRIQNFSRLKLYKENTQGNKTCKNKE